MSKLGPEDERTAWENECHSLVPDMLCFIWTSETGTSSTRAAEKRLLTLKGTKSSTDRNPKISPGQKLLRTSQRRPMNGRVFQTYLQGKSHSLSKAG
eukprot:1161667-Pelagomonas_calceolata.AAC.17